MDSKKAMNPATPKKKIDSKNEFAATKPLPPIGHTDKGEESDIDERLTDDTRSVDRDDARSSVSQGSTTAFDRPGEGSARPRIIRGFRPEIFSDDELLDEEKKLDRRVSFSKTKMSDKGPALREVTKRKTYDGRDITFVSLDTQTDWDWVSDIEAVTARGLDSERSTIEDTSGPGPAFRSEVEDSLGEARLPTEGSAYKMPYSDEYGIPILDLSSDTDDSSDEEYTAKKKIKDDRNFIPSVGPPQILQYQRESEKEEIDVEAPKSRLPRIDSEEEDELEKDEHGLPHGMFSGKCEFCHKQVKPFPSLDQQLQFAPEELYCCNDYREFVEYVLNTTAELEKEELEKSKLISVKVHDHVGSKQERNAAKEKAVQRMRERELQRRQQEATGLQQNFITSMQMAGVGGLTSGYKGFFKRAAPLTMKDVFAEPSVGSHNVRLSNAGLLTPAMSKSGSHYAGTPVTGTVTAGVSAGGLPAKPAIGT